MKKRWIPLCFMLVWMSNQAVAELPDYATPVRHLFGDFDNDGLKDLFVLNRPGNKLFRNFGNGEFEDVTALAFSNGAKRGITGTWGDYNRDEWLDLFLFHKRGFVLFCNDAQGHFVDVTEAAGLDPTLMGDRVRLEDYDMDGYEDLLLQTPQGDRIYHNCGDGTFEEVKLPGIGGGKGGTILPGGGSGDQGIPQGNLPGTGGGNLDADNPKPPKGSSGAPPALKPSFDMLKGGPPKKLGNPGQDPAPTADAMRDNDWDYWTNPPHMFSIPEGNVGIGTDEPRAKLTVNGAILRHGSTMWGDNSYSHINLGRHSSTGEWGKNYDSATVSGGKYNNASFNNTTVSGGSYNNASGGHATVGGGNKNTASEQYSTVGGGRENTASGINTTIGGGKQNTASGQNATVCGGRLNNASGVRSTVCGGENNEASGVYSFAAGKRAKANHDGTFVWADNANADFVSTGEKQFLIRASGGVGIGTSSPSEQLEVAGHALIEGPEGFNSIDEEAAVYFGDTNHYVKGVHGFGVKIGTWGAGDVISIRESSGKVGIGTITPLAKLEVSNSSPGGFAVSAQNTASSNNAYLGGSNYGVKSEGDLIVDGAYRGNIGPAGGAPFPRPAYDSGWHDTKSKTLIHNIGGDPGKYYVELLGKNWEGKICKLDYNTVTDGVFDPNGKLVGLLWENYGAKWGELTSSTIKIWRGGCESGHMRVRIWVYK